MQHRDRLLIYIIIEIGVKNILACFITLFGIRINGFVSNFIFNNLF
jgi:hypothetical protein